MEKERKDFKLDESSAVPIERFGIEDPRKKFIENSVDPMAAFIGRCMEPGFISQKDINEFAEKAVVYAFRIPEKIEEKED